MGAGRVGLLQAASDTHSPYLDLVKTRKIDIQNNTEGLKYIVPSSTDFENRFFTGNVFTKKRLLRPHFESPPPVNLKQRGGNGDTKGGGK